MDPSKDWCHPEGVYGRSYMMPTAISVVLVEKQPEPRYREIELKNMLFEFASKSYLVPVLDLRRPDLLMFTAGKYGSCSPFVEITSVTPDGCMVVKVSEGSGVWSPRVLDLYTRLDEQLEQLNGVRVVRYIKPESRQNDVLGKDWESYPGKSLDPVEICGEVLTSGA